MNKKEYIAKITEKLRLADKRKRTQAKKFKFQITDDEGTSRNFVISKSGSALLFNSDDVQAILDAALEVAEETLMRGGEISIHGYGVLGLHLRSSRMVRHPQDGVYIEIPQRYVTKFSPGKILQIAARTYENKVTGRSPDELKAELEDYESAATFDDEPDDYEPDDLTEDVGDEEGGEQ